MTRTRRDSYYRGESPPKKMARILFWRAVKKLLGKKFTTSNYLVIPSQYAGDLSTLTALGVCEHQIYCVDIDKHAIAAARFKYPNAHYACCSFGEAFEQFPELKHNLGCAFIDLCCPLRAEVISQVLAIGKYSKLLGFEFKYGRETGSLLRALDLKKNEEASVLPRLKFVQRVKEGGRHFIAKESWAYCSHSDSHNGSPMFICLGFSGFVQSHLHTFTQIKCTEKDVRATCINQPENWRLWNVAESTTIAWRAHESRGTYR